MNSALSSCGACKSSIVLLEVLLGVHAGRANARACASMPLLPAIRLVRLVSETWSDRDWAEHDAGTEIARRRREHRSWKLDDFRWFGTPTFRRGEKIMMVTREDSGQELVDPPATVLYVRSYPYKNGRASLVFVEGPKRRRRALRHVAKQLGPGGRKRLKRGGRLGRAMSNKLYDIWKK
jgi:hypothetical protein